MLVLGRYEGEAIIIRCGSKVIRVVVVQAGGKVKLGIEAPVEVRVVREELVANT